MKKTLWYSGGSVRYAASKEECEDVITKSLRGIFSSHVLLSFSNEFSIIESSPPVYLLDPDYGSTKNNCYKCSNEYSYECLYKISISFEDDDERDC